MVFTDQAECGGSRLTVLRLPKRNSWKQRIQSARSFITDFDPNWLSLQFVSYSFQDKGIPFLLGPRLATLGNGRNWHIMFHELWENGVGFRKELIGKGQKFIIKSILRILSAKLVNASTSHNLSLLRSINYSADLLPLFGNIPIAYEDVSAPTATDPTFGPSLKGIYFGSAPNSSAQTIIVEGLVEYSRATEKSLNIILAGSLGAHGPEFIKSLEGLANLGINITITGFLSTHDLSQLIQSSDFGISKSPGKHLGKSGSLITMIEHGLPIWCPMMGSGQSVKDDFYNGEASLLLPNLVALQPLRKCPRPRLSQTAAKFIYNLQSKVNND